ncbi:MAG: hypothetical protein IH599_00495 [Bacteroidales bacterium]|nr:hypothetical protein [Bacteroidales bacterium]
MKMTKPEHDLVIQSGWTGKSLMKDLPPKEWTVRRTGRSQYLLYFGLASLAIYIVMAGHSYRSEDISFQRFLFFSPIIFSIGILAWITSFVPEILKKPVPLRIAVGPQQGYLEFSFKQRQDVRYSREDISFSYHSYFFYNALRIFEPAKGSRGQYFLVERLSIIGVRWGYGWTNRLIEDVTKELKEAGFNEYKIEDKDLLNHITE